MNLAFYISRKILATKKGSFSRTIVRLAIASIAISVAILILTFSILGGFKTTIENKIYSLESHIQISKSAFYKKDFGTTPISAQSEISKIATDIPGVKSINQFAFQRGVLHANNHVFGVLVKGYDKDFDTNYFSPNIIEGSFIDFKEGGYSRDIIISEFIANQLQLQLNDDLIYYFYNKGNFKPKKLQVKGIYRTYIEEFDQRMVLTDLNLLRKLNAWNDTTTGGFELYTDVVSKEKMDGKAISFETETEGTSLSELTKTVEDLSDYDLFATSIETKYIYLFDWLNLLDQQVAYFLLIIACIILINIISAMYIFIKERTNMIGSFKAFGATGYQLNLIFWISGFRILLKGLVYGNLLGLGICLLQLYFTIIPLEPESYYMDAVPVLINFWTVLKINIAMVICVMVFLSIPLFQIKKISPIRSIKFD